MYALLLPTKLVEIFGSTSRFSLSLPLSNTAGVSNEGAVAYGRSVTRSVNSNEPIPVCHVIAGGQAAHYRTRGGDLRDSCRVAVLPNLPLLGIDSQKQYNALLEQLSPSSTLAVVIATPRSARTNVQVFHRRS